ncbi:MAG: ClbS/DfsB family four-helix bundle protein [Candidatus Heimdallarchaeota archaeon]|nr:ClbS/DfsB family four-helix bundle protein [Candidatus Heimdallarchaeota archaeon]MCK4771114.1 ClbS/DfsB family four-helix bundle protein [Candidatus Heimdallarchaeota archaeon]
MTKQQIMDFLSEDHDKMEFVVESLHKEEMMSLRIQGNWNVKDILVHVASWNKELTKSCDLLLKNEKLWFVEDPSKIKQLEADFNVLKITIKRSSSLEEVIEEWQDSFNKLLSKIDSFSEEELNFITDYLWATGNPVTIKSLFGYRYKGDEHGHEGGHAKVIDDYFSEDRCGCKQY